MDARADKSQSNFFSKSTPETSSEESDSDDGCHNKRNKANIIENAPRKWFYIGDEIKEYKPNRDDEDISRPGHILYNNHEAEAGWPIYFEEDPELFNILNAKRIKENRWNNAYIFIKNTAELFFIRDYLIERVQIDDINKFIASFKEIMLVRRLVYTMKHLDDRQVYRLITSNGGHTPHAILAENLIEKPSRSIRFRKFFIGLFPRIKTKDKSDTNTMDVKNKGRMP